MKERRTTNFYYPSFTRYSIDSTDELILDWIYSFAFSGNMKSMELYCPTTKDTETFYWVNYEALIKDYNGELGKKGILSVTSKSGLAKRLAILVQKKILYFYRGNLVDKDGTVHKGTYTLFAINFDAYLDLIGEAGNDADFSKDEAESQKNFIHTSPPVETSPRRSGRPGVAGQGEPNIIKLEYYKATSSSRNKIKGKETEVVSVEKDRSIHDDDEETSLKNKINALPVYPAKNLTPRALLDLCRRMKKEPDHLALFDRPRLETGLSVNCYSP